MNKHLVTVAIVLATMAVANRVAPVKTIVNPS